MQNGHPQDEYSEIIWAGDNDSPATKVAKFLNRLAKLNNAPRSEADIQNENANFFKTLKTSSRNRPVQSEQDFTKRLTRIKSLAKKSTLHSQKTHQLMQAIRNKFNDITTLHIKNNTSRNQVNEIKRKIIILTKEIEALQLQIDDALPNTQILLHTPQEISPLPTAISSATAKIAALQNEKEKLNTLRQRMDAEHQAYTKRIQITFCTTFKEITHITKAFFESMDLLNKENEQLKHDINQIKNKYQTSLKKNREILSFKQLPQEKKTPIPNRVQQLKSLEQIDTQRHPQHINQSCDELYHLIGKYTPNLELKEILIAHSNTHVAIAETIMSKTIDTLIKRNDDIPETHQLMEAYQYQQRLIRRIQLLNTLQNHTKERSQQFTLAQAIHALEDLKGRLSSYLSPTALKIATHNLQDVQDFSTICIILECTNYTRLQSEAFLNIAIRLLKENNTGKTERVLQRHGINIKDIKNNLTKGVSKIINGYIHSATLPYSGSLNNTSPSLSLIKEAIRYTDASSLLRTIETKKLYQLMQYNKTTGNNTPDFDDIAKIVTQLFSTSIHNNKKTSFIIALLEGGWCLRFFMHALSEQSNNQEKIQDLFLEMIKNDLFDEAILCYIPSIHLYETQIIDAARNEKNHFVRSILPHLPVSLQCKIKNDVFTIHLQKALR